MKYNNVIRGVAAVAVVALGTSLQASSASALTINSTFGGGTAHASTTGTGNLQSIFTAAADWWEAAILDTHTLNLRYQWGGLGVLGSHSLTGEGGTPHRETAGTITFDNDGTTAWWRDATPYDSSEFSTFNTFSADLGGGVINTGRVYTGGNFGAFFDLFNTAIHEIGHALGMSSANDAFVAEARTPNPGDSDIDVDRAGFVGTVLPVRLTSAHYLSTGDTAQASLGRFVSTGSRHMLSCVDILGNAQISQFTNFNCDPDNPSTISEPGTLAVLGLGLVGLAFARRRRAV